MTTDIIGLEIEPGARVALIGRRPRGMRALRRGTVIAVDDGFVLWRDDERPPSDRIWSMQTDGCSLDTRGTYAPPERPGVLEHVTPARNLKVTRRAA